MARRSLFFLLPLLFSLCLSQVLTPSGSDAFPLTTTTFRLLYVNTILPSTTAGGTTTPSGLPRIPYIRAATSTSGSAAGIPLPYGLPIAVTAPANFVYGYCVYPDATMTSTAVACFKPSTVGGGTGVLVYRDATEPLALFESYSTVDGLLARQGQVRYQIVNLLPTPVTFKVDNVDRTGNMEPVVTFKSVFGPVPTAGSAAVTVADATSGASLNSVVVTPLKAGSVAHVFVFPSTIPTGVSMAVVDVAVAQACSTCTPIPTPTPTPTAIPTAIPTAGPSAYPSVGPTPFPTAGPSAYPTPYPCNPYPAQPSWLPPTYVPTPPPAPTYSYPPMPTSTSTPVPTYTPMPSFAPTAPPPAPTYSYPPTPAPTTPPPPTPTYSSVPIPASFPPMPSSTPPAQSFTPLPYPSSGPRLLPPRCAVDSMICKTNFAADGTITCSAGCAACPSQGLNGKPYCVAMQTNAPCVTPLDDVFAIFFPEPLACPVVATFDGMGMPHGVSNTCAAAVAGKDAMTALDQKCQDLQSTLDGYDKAVPDAAPSASAAPTPDLGAATKLVAAACTNSCFIRAVKADQTVQTSCAGDSLGWSGAGSARADAPSLATIGPAFCKKNDKQEYCGVAYARVAASLGDGRGGSGPGKLRRGALSALGSAERDLAVALVPALQKLRRRALQTALPSSTYMPTAAPTSPGYPTYTPTSLPSLPPCPSSAPMPSCPPGTYPGPYGGCNPYPSAPAYPSMAPLPTTFPSRPPMPSIPAPLPSVAPTAAPSAMPSIDPSICSSAFKPELMDTIKSLGCCAGEIIRAAIPPSELAFTTSLFRACGLPVDGCVADAASQGYFVGSVVIKIARWSDQVAALIKDAAQADIALNAKVDISRVVITSIGPKAAKRAALQSTAAAVEVEIQFKIAGDDSQSSGLKTAQANLETAGTSFDISNVNAALVSSGQPPASVTSAPVTSSITKGSGETAKNSATSLRSPAILLLLALATALLL